MILRISGEKAKNGMTADHRRCQLATTAGYSRPHGLSLDSLRALAAVPALVAAYIGLSALPHCQPSFPMVGCVILGISTRGQSEVFSGIFNGAQRGGASQATATV